MATSQDTVTPIAPSVPLSESDHLKQLLEENLALSKKIFVQNKKIQRRMTFMAVSDGLRLLLIVIPLIIAAIFLPPLIKPAMQQYQDLLQTSSTLNTNKDAISQLLDVLK